MGNLIAAYDLDRIKYKVASAGEARSIDVVNRKHGIEATFKTRSEFWGKARSRDGGWLAKNNKDEGLSLTWEDFEIEDVQEVDEIANVFHSAKVMIAKDIEKSGATKVQYFIGMGDTYREDKSTLLRYKDRDDLLKPILLGELADFLIRTYQPKLITGIEADDAVTMYCYNHKNRFVLSEDKDSYAQPTLVYSPLYPKEGIVDCTGFGELWVEEKVSPTTGKKSKKIRGKGRKFLYWQILFGDNVDNYKANCFSSKRWGEQAAFKALEHCENDKQCWETLVECFKTLYPERKKITGWRGDEFEIDWFYVLNEMFQMARMLRFKGDEVNINDVMDKLGVVR